MAPTTTEQHHSEEERPDSHNIWDKTFKITDRCDSDASMVFTGMSELPVTLKIQCLCEEWWLSLLSWRRLSHCNSNDCITDLGGYHVLMSSLHSRYDGLFHSDCLRM